MRKLILTALLLKLTLLAQAQMFSATFEYDENGNRINAEVIYLSKATPRENQEILKEEVDKNLSVKFYPNPTLGIVSFKIDDPELENLNSTLNYIKVYDLSGRMIMNVSPVLKLNEINLSGYKDGVYLVRLKIGEISKSYKIIKQ